MKKVWDTQNNEPLYVLNESALHNRVQVKKRKAGHITNISELLAIVANIGGGGFILATTLSKESSNVYLYLLAAWMFVTAIYCVVGRIRRIRSNTKFDRSILGDIDQAIATASYQVRLSGLLRWNIVPISVLIFLGLWSGEKSIWIAIGLVVFFAVTWYATGWEHNYYKSRRNEVQQLRNLLVNSDTGGTITT
ncbi:MAG TPA: hypothetical protein VFE50_18365 [Cyclobacteriaceae bacterium]|nr:hypothetical protein [Cyclobacteriaceae bacterium]